MPDTRHTQRLVLQPYAVPDAPEVYNLVKANEAWLIPAFPRMIKGTQTPESTIEYIEQRQNDWEQRTAFAFGIRLKENRRLIGHIMLKSIDWTVPKCELGYWISDHEKGKGFMKEVVQDILIYCFEELNMQKVFLRIAPDNIPSLQLAEKCGFKKEGLLKNEFRTADDRLIDL